MLDNLLNHTAFSLASSVFSIRNGIAQAREKSWSQLHSFFHTDFHIGRAGSGNRKSSTQAQLREYRSLIYTILTTIAGRCASVPWGVFVKQPDGELKELKNHQLVDLLTMPNKFMTGNFLKQYIQTQKDLTGKAFILKLRNGLGKPGELWPLDAGKLLKIETGTTNQDLITGYTFREKNGATITYPEKDVIYMRYVHPWDLIDGMSPVQAMSMMIDIETYIEIYERDLFEHGAEPGLILSATTDSKNPKLLKEQRERILEEWNAKHQGPHKKHLPTILQNMEATVINTTNRDFEFLNLVTWTSENLFAAYSVPREKLFPKKVNKANAESVEITFNQDSIQPRLNDWDLSVTIDLAHEFDEKLVVKHENPVPQDKAFQLKKDESDIKNFINSVDEVRERRGEKPSEWGKKPWGGFNLVQLEASNNNETTPPEKPEEEPEKSCCPPNPNVKHNKSVKNRFLDTKEKRVAYWKQFDRQAQAQAAAFRRPLRKLFKEQEEDVQMNLKRVGPKLESMFAGWRKQRIGFELKQNQRLINDILFENNPWEKKFTKAGRPHIQNSVTISGDQVLVDLGIDAGFDVTNKRAADFIKDRSVFYSKELNGTTRKALRKTLREGFLEGETIPKLAKRVRDVYDIADKSRSTMIARTEIIGASNFGNLEGMKQSKIVKKKEWITSQDDRVRDAHGETPNMDGVVVGLNEDFEPGDGATQYPDSFNERCTVIPVIE